MAGIPIIEQGRLMSQRESIRPTPESSTRPIESSRAAQFRAALLEPGLTLLMEAHSGISARIVEEAGFRGIWASGLAISAVCGTRDCNEMSWTQILEIVEYMADATTIPILLDADTGYGNFNNFRRLVRKLAQRKVAAVCIEDKTFPKTNSFLDGQQKLVPIDEFAGKLRAGRDALGTDDMCIVARTEALIAGLGLDEALARAAAYRDAGADAILIHSKQRTAAEVLAFAREWDGRCPLIVVPTTYFRTPFEELERAGISIAICANHNLRASIASMRQTTRRIKEARSLAALEPDVVSIGEVFALTRTDELEAAEARYAPPVPRPAAKPSADAPEPPNRLVTERR